MLVYVDFKSYIESWKSIPSYISSRLKDQWHFIITQNVPYLFFSHMSTVESLLLQF